MISTRLFQLLLLSAVGLIALQLLSGIWLFVQKYGFAPHEVYLYFSGDEVHYIMPKTLAGLMETAVPHFISVSTTIFVYAHFLLFTQIISENKKQLLITGLFASAAIDIFSPFIIIYGFELFAWLKIIAFLSFEILMTVLLCTLLCAYWRVRKA